MIANKGYFYTPHVIKKIDGKPNTSRNLDTKHFSKVDRQYFDIIQDGMQKSGSRNRKNRPIRHGHHLRKTGTAQNPHGKDHSLFVACTRGKSENRYCRDGRERRDLAQHGPLLLPA
ncbi:MAG: hypothetical protein IPJ86_18815 [Bacteroidetes bacterium]|nr:hypothetical protein [Bacteroidota bacterium]